MPGMGTLWVWETSKWPLLSIWPPQNTLFYEKTSTHRIQKSCPVLFMPPPWPWLTEMQLFLRVHILFQVQGLDSEGDHCWIWIPVHKSGEHVVSKDLTQIDLVLEFGQWEFRKKGVTVFTTVMVVVVTAVMSITKQQPCSTLLFKKDLLTYFLM